MCKREAASLESSKSMLKEQSFENMTPSHKSLRWLPIIHTIENSALLCTLVPSHPLWTLTGAGAKSLELWFCLFFWVPVIAPCIEGCVLLTSSPTDPSKSFLILAPPACFPVLQIPPLSPPHSPIDPCLHVFCRCHCSECPLLSLWLSNSYQFIKTQQEDHLALQLTSLTPFPSP